MEQDEINKTIKERAEYSWGASWGRHNQADLGDEETTMEGGSAKPALKQE